MIPKKDFLKKYNIPESSFEKTGLEWKQLEGIYNTYEKVITTLEPILVFFVESLRKAPKVHSIKARLKDTEHLIEKIIRLKQNDPALEITADNYDKVITDIIGLRALHLFKADWESIHDWIMNSLEVEGKPVINLREGDQPEFVSLFEKKGCDVKKHPFGYRSAHYLVAARLSKKVVLVEIQVRTIFEEGWSEIDHLIRYPYVKDNPILEQYLVMFNRLAGSADEMASYLMYLNAALKSKELEFSKAIEKKSEKNEELQKKIGELEAKIEKIEMEQDDKASLRLGLEQISDITTSIPDYSNLIPKIPDYSNLISKIPDYSNLISNIPDYSKLISKIPDYSNLISKIPDYSKLIPKMPDFSSLTAPTIDIPNSSAMDVLKNIEDLEGSADQKSSSSDEEDKTDDDQHKKKGQEKKGEDE